MGRQIYNTVSIGALREVGYLQGATGTQVKCEYMFVFAGGSDLGMLESSQKTGLGWDVKDEREFVRWAWRYY